MTAEISSGLAQCPDCGHIMRPVNDDVMACDSCHRYIALPPAPDITHIA